MSLSLVVRACPTASQARSTEVRESLACLPTQPPQHLMMQMFCICLCLRFQLGGYLSQLHHLSSNRFNNRLYSKNINQSNSNNSIPQRPVNNCVAFQHIPQPLQSERLNLFSETLIGR